MCVGWSSGRDCCGLHEEVGQMRKKPWEDELNDVNELDLWEVGYFCVTAV